MRYRRATERILGARLTEGFFVPAGKTKYLTKKKPTSECWGENGCPLIFVCFSFLLFFLQWFVFWRVSWFLGSSSFGGTLGMLSGAPGLVFGLHRYSLRPVLSVTRHQSLLPSWRFITNVLRLDKRLKLCTYKRLNRCTSEWFKVNQDFCFYKKKIENVKLKWRSFYSFIFLFYNIACASRRHPFCSSLIFWSRKS